MLAQRVRGVKCFFASLRGVAFGGFIRLHLLSHNAIFYFRQRKVPRDDIDRGRSRGGMGVMVGGLLFSDERQNATNVVAGFIFANSKYFTK
jgi:hypothetical protein